MTFPSAPSEWTEYDEVLRLHRDRVGRDRAEITRSIHLGFPTDDDPSALRDQADEFFDVGVNLVVWSMRGDLDARRLEPLAAAMR